MIPDFLEQHAFDQPNRRFVRIDNEWVTYSEFNNAINYFINKVSISKDSKRVAVLSENPVVTLISIIGCNRMSKIPIIIPSDNLLSKECLEVTDYDCVIEEKDCIIQYKQKSKYYAYQYNGEDVQCVLFTSGASSLPKGVELTFSNINYSCVNWSSVYDFKESDIYLNILPLHHISGLSIFFRSLYANCHLIVERYKKENILDLISSNNITCLSIVPKILYDLKDDDNAVSAIKNIRFLLVGGDSISESIFNFLHSNNINAYISYGLTETSSGISGYWINDVQNFKFGYIGTPHNQTKLSIINGRLNIHSKTVMKKYSGSDLNCKNFLTTDFFVEKNLKFYFKGRRKKQIVSGGENINLDYIQHAIEQSDLMDVLVTSFDSDKWGDVIVALYVSKNINKDIEINIASFFKNNLPNFMQPKYIIHIDEFPKLSNQKINYKNIKYYLERNL